jgi:biopolymer transport protein ExbD
MHDFLSKPKRHHVKEIPLAPILDLLTVVIFFLILSASFIELRQETLPPSSQVTATPQPNTPPIVPLNPKLMMTNKDGEIILLLKWFGTTPGQTIKKLRPGVDRYDIELKNAANELAKELKKMYPLESQIQLGWQSDIKYQTVLTVVDGVMPEIKDLVFLAPDETEILIEKSM